MDDREKRRLRARNLAVGGALLLLVLFFYVLTIARIGSNLP